MKEKESIPFAPHLVESMRSIGYSFETAIADLIDNSISANASKIEILFTPSENPQVIIFDNGCGMTENELEEALRYGSRNPLEIKNDNDLGRFGLGMKSASLSQCRKLIVASKKNDIISCFSWDLDKIIEKGNWVLLQYSEEIKDLPMINLFDNVDTGTYILLQNFDKVSSSTKNLYETMNRFMNITIDHLSLVFHRFLNEGVEIYVNNDKIKAKDPFLTNNNSTISLREQSFEIEGRKILVKPYILPYINKLKQEDFEKIGGKEDLKTNQGFYIYRNKRLIIWGTWFRLTRKDELTKLARIKVDIPSTLDYMCNIDIKKSSASLPDIIKKNLYACIDESIFKSKIVHEYRGRKTYEDTNVNHIWERIELRDGCYEYKINRDIPILNILISNLDKEQQNLLETFIKNIEMTFPTTSIYIDTAKGEIDNEKQQELEELYDEINKQLEFAKNNNLEVKELLEIILKTEPYCRYDELVNRFGGKIDE